MKEALFYEKLDGGSVRCNLCERRCSIPLGGRGVCLVRKNANGRLYSLVYGKPVSIALDPMEKKPLFHFYPGTSVLSYATAGCNFKCLFCQNWEISQALPENVPSREVSPEEMAEIAVHMGSVGIAHTYTEPTVFYEYARDIGILAKEKGLVNVFVTNGYFTREVLKDMKGWLDAANVDLKGDADFYRRVVGGADVEVVRRNIRDLYRAGIHVEVTTLIVPGYNDDPEWYRAFVVDFLRSISPDIPLHITRFHPDYKMREVPPTPVDTLIRLRALAMEEGMRYVYIGNVGNPKYETTYCPNCGAPVIERSFYHVRVLLEGNRCPRCGYKIKVVGVKGTQGSSTRASSLR